MVAAEQPPAFRYRIEYGEHGDLRFAGHLDVYRAWERTFRRAAIQLAYSQGFNPRPRINIGLALPLGCTSRADLMDVWLAEPVEPDELARRLRGAAPPGLQIETARAVDDRQPTLQQQIRAAEFEVELGEAQATEVGPRIEEVMRAEQLPRERRGKPYDLRPLIEGLELRGPVLRMRLAVGNSGVGRADEVLRALGLEAESLTPIRTRLVLDN